MSRILLLGELSGVHQDLRHGLLHLGHEVVVAHSRLATDEFASDIPLFRPPPGPLSRQSMVREVASQLRHANKMTGFDVVQVMTHKFFNWKIQARMLAWLKARNKKLVIVNTACSKSYNQMASQLAYRPCDDCLKLDLSADRCPYDSKAEREAEELAFGLADAVVSTQYDYSMSLGQHSHASKVVRIALPVNTDVHRYAPLPQGDAVRIYYGETRHGYKGGRHILEALRRFEGSVHSSLATIVHTPRIPFREYLEELDQAHIVIDQANSFSAGMNALYAMARGRVVLTGAEPESSAYFGISPQDNPAINIRPDADQIFEVLRGLVLNRQRLPVIGAMSADYVARYHTAPVVAEKYDLLYRRLLADERGHVSGTA